KIARKMQASKEVWGKIFGTIDTREKFLDQRLVLATHEWTRLKANDSPACRNCPDYASMDLTRQATRPARIHRTFLATGQAPWPPATGRRRDAPARPRPAPPATSGRCTGGAAVRP